MMPGRLENCDQNLCFECNVTYGFDCTVGAPILMLIVKLINPAVLLDKNVRLVQLNCTVGQTVRRSL